MMKFYYFFKHSIKKYKKLNTPILYSKIHKKYDNIATQVNNILYNNNNNITNMSLYISIIEKWIKWIKK